MEQTKAVCTLVSGGDLLTVLNPTGSGKGLIFQLLVRVKEILTGKTSSVIACLLKGIVQDQLAEVFDGADRSITCR